ncbi:hypothetical protein Tco_0994748 [Tanacetum coccineum]
MTLSVPTITRSYEVSFEPLLLYQWFVRRVAVKIETRNGDRECSYQASVAFAFISLLLFRIVNVEHVNYHLQTTRCFLLFWSPYPPSALDLSSKIISFPDSKAISKLLSQLKYSHLCDEPLVLGITIVALSGKSLPVVFYRLVLSLRAEGNVSR